MDLHDKTLKHYNFNTTLVFIYREEEIWQDRATWDFNTTLVFIYPIKWLQRKLNQLWFQYNSCFYLSWSSDQLLPILDISIQLLFLFIAARLLCSLRRVYFNTTLVFIYHKVRNSKFFRKRISIQLLFLFIVWLAALWWICFLISIQLLFLFIKEWVIKKKRYIHFNTTLVFIYQSSRLYPSFNRAYFNTTLVFIYPTYFRHSLFPL